ncbi:CDGSH iron-sulfur domain-containing protein [Candidatus Clostridium radicumherbarum]|uniref:CDGSH iron-sulfur domain-containing protein n=1 Tax=Candidatus Clostridium radicumherbarum TaxID=3381662 RepID=A0ABW8TV50_9CLOT
MANVKIQAIDDGPFMVKGEVEIVDGEGNTMDTKEECYLCRCGLSKNKPYCDGSHKDKFQSRDRAK